MKQMVEVDFGDRDLGLPGKVVGIEFRPAKKGEWYWNDNVGLAVRTDTDFVTLTTPVLILEPEMEWYEPTVPGLLRAWADAIEKGAELKCQGRDDVNDDWGDVDCFRNYSSFEDEMYPFGLGRDCHPYIRIQRPVTK